MRRSSDGLQIPTTAFEAAAWQDLVRVRCRCGHWATHDPHGLWWFCRRRSWNDHFADLQQRFYCTVCFAVDRRKVRPTSIDTCSSGDATITLPRPPDREWKRALRRYRS
jgi:hypothetical protein